MNALIPKIFKGQHLPKLSQVISHLWRDRDSILRSDVNLFCWKRSSDAKIFSYLNSLLASRVEPIKIRVDEDQLTDQIKKTRTEWDLQTSCTSEAFWRDVSQLTRDFLAFSTTKSGTLYLKVIEDNSCTKFHTDGYALRLFTTYYGKGTEWLPETAVNRQGLGTTNDRIVKDVKQIQRMEPFEVGILKGEPSRGLLQTKGIVHRSPAIEKENLKRVILRIDI